MRNSNLSKPSLKILSGGYIGNLPTANEDNKVQPLLPNFLDDPAEQKNPDYFNQQRRQIDNFPGLLPIEFSELTARKLHPADRATAEPPMLPAGIDPNICFDCN